MLVVEQGLAESREKAKALIMAGRVLVDDSPATKAGANYPVDAALRVRGGGAKYVSRGGEKLEGALDDFGIDPAGLVAIDLGASTGGFTDCLLQRGARSVTAVDVGYGQLAMKLRNDPRVTVREKSNARNVAATDFDSLFDMAVVDVSFISLLKVLPAARELLKAGGFAVTLVKPQFEAGRAQVGKGGVVKPAATHIEVLEKITAGAVALGLHTSSITFSRLKGPKGNIEYFSHFFLDPARGNDIDCSAVVNNAHSFFQNM